MPKEREYLYLVGDFETSVYENQTETEVWASGICPLWTEDAVILTSIESTWNYLYSLKRNVCIYYHNLKFDGNFWLSFLLRSGRFKLAWDKDKQRFLDDYKMPYRSFKYTISDMGQWYRILIRTQYGFIDIRDSLKLLPFKLSDIAEGFKTKHKKLTMEYVGERHANGIITQEEQDYLKNDLYVLKEALEFLFSEGHKSMTIGSCCLHEFKQGFDKREYDSLFPNLYNYKIDPVLYQQDSAGEYIRRAYRGGWCYVVPEKTGKIYRKGCTMDVNSLYPSQMHSASGNKYPYGLPTFWCGNFIPEKAESPNKFYYIRFRCRFYLKKGKLPFMQIKGSPLYKGTENLTTSDVWDAEKEEYSRYYKDRKGRIFDTVQILTMTQADFVLFKEHYILKDFEILSGCYFQAMSGFFDPYIDKWAKVKQTSKGAMRQTAKLFLNNLYGKEASTPDSAFKLAYVKEDESIGFRSIPANDKIPGYIAIGAAITSYARCFTIRAAQKNFYGTYRPGFIYADTDSIHCDLPKEKIKGIRIHETEFNAWKCESEWELGYFLRQKTYCEAENGKYDLKCAGLPVACKQLFIDSITKNFRDGYTEQERKFLFDETGKPIERTILDFKPGITIPDKLKPQRIKGGVVLRDTPFTLKES